MIDASLSRLCAAIGQAISVLLGPDAEVVLHDLETGRIAGIWNPFSRRRVGDPSLLDPAEIHAGDDGVIGPYPKTGVAGERIRSVSVILSNPGSGSKDAGAPVGVLCINLDVSRLDQAARLLAAFAAPLQDQPPALFDSDWREQMQTAFHAWLRVRGLAAASLSRQERIAVVAALYSKHLFQTRNATSHAAQMLGISRTSLYNDLRAARATGGQG